MSEDTNSYKKPNIKWTKQALIEFIDERREDLNAIQGAPAKLEVALQELKDEIAALNK